MERYDNVVYVHNMDPNNPATSYKSNEILFLSRRKKRPDLHVKLRRWKGTKAQLDTKVMELITAFLKKKQYGYAFTAEAIGLHLGIHVHEIKQSLHRLNLAGKVNQAARYFAHDSNRNPFYGGHKSGWAANHYHLRSKA